MFMREINLSLGQVKKPDNQQKRTQEWEERRGPLEKEEDVNNAEVEGDITVIDDGKHQEEA